MAQRKGGTWTCGGRDLQSVKQQSYRSSVWGNVSSHRIRKNGSDADVFVAL
jgi:hypothetical protein